EGRPHPLARPEREGFNARERVVRRPARPPAGAAVRLRAGGRGGRRAILPPERGGDVAARASATGGSMSWRLGIRHETVYRYAADVTSSYNEARITPLTTDRQIVVT